MTSVFYLRICLISSCANALLLHANHPLNIHSGVAVARRTTRAQHVGHTGLKYRHRRNHSAPNSNSNTLRSRRRRPQFLVSSPDFLRRTSHSFASKEVVVARRHSGIETRVPGDESLEEVDEHEIGMEDLVSMQNSLEEVMFGDPPLPAPQPDDSHVGRCGRTESSPPPAPPLQRSPSENLSESRSARSMSSASRSTNRLSLTLPIAPPSAFPSRPMPMSPTSSPPMELDTPSLLLPTDSGEFITAIAIQERRVLELKEELHCARSELRHLKNSFSRHESRKEEASRGIAEPLRLFSPQRDGQIHGQTQQSVEIDRRKALMLLQRNAPERRRRVFTGSHTRTLSLLSPRKGFIVHEDGPGVRDSESASADTRHEPITPSQLAKRASWTPRSAHQQASGLKQVATDIKIGLWNFVEDIRQATVGDEATTGHADGAGPFNTHETNDTIRASAAKSRPRAQALFDGTLMAASQLEEFDEFDSSVTGTPSKQPRPLGRSKTDATGASRQLSWTPLTSDHDQDWSSWGTPVDKSPRWSGSTVNGDMTPVSNSQDENAPLANFDLDTPLPARSPTMANKLEELLPPVLNRLSPTKLKQTATYFMKEWEKKSVAAQP